ncbi:MAG TPA: DUF72 domain-containing protein [Candidatus Binatia bacterium]|nr:DUF72 domain-containing protein [Candidatus Binatia bacterium]
MKAFIGTSGWQYKHWNARFFPEDLPKKDWLNYLSQKFNTVEVNTTFYHMARASTFEKWRIESEKGFIFTLKMYRLFTHFKKLDLSKEDLETLNAFIKNAKGLKEKFGPILIQFPPSFKADYEKLINFISNLRKIEKKNKVKLKIATEFRHGTWFNEETYKLLKKLKIALVITNSPKWPYAIKKTTDFVYMRFHGRTKLFASNYTEEELREWKKVLQGLKAKNTYAYFNNDANAYAADNALYLKKLFGKVKA